ncbi:hypothetical protein BS78_05G108200 [Paspalum vaginatum]|nr:hypothetical protein BS78_05G108200 [Paspalum vaginatum]
MLLRPAPPAPSSHVRAAAALSSASGRRHPQARRPTGSGTRVPLLTLPVDARGLYSRRRRPCPVLPRPASARVRPAAPRPPPSCCRCPRPRHPASSGPRLPPMSRRPRPHRPRPVNRALIPSFRVRRHPRLPPTSGRPRPPSSASGRRNPRPPLPASGRRRPQPVLPPWSAAPLPRRRWCRHRRGSRRPRCESSGSSSTGSPPRRCCAGVRAEAATSHHL